MNAADFKGYDIALSIVAGRPFVIRAWHGGSVDGPYLCDPAALRRIVPQLRAKGHVRRFGLQRELRPAVGASLIEPPPRWGSA